jgi:ribosomal protein L7Ae-like RNA K-turn-binding protein
MDDRAIGLIGLMRRASAIEIGEDNSGSAVSAGKAKLLLIAADVSENVLRHAERITQGRRVITVPLHYTREELGKTLGIGGCSMAAVTDIGLANALMKALSEQKPDMYAQAAETIEQRQAKAARRKKETAALKGSRRNDKRRTGA